MLHQPSLLSLEIPKEDARGVPPGERRTETTRSPGGHTELLLARRTAELRASEARYRTLVERAPEAIVAIDGESALFTEANENALRLFGVDRATLMTLGPAEVSPPVQPDGKGSREAVIDKMKEALETEGVPVFEWVHRDRAGRDFPCEVRVARVPTEGRNLFIATVTDISERKAVESKLAVFAALAERTSDSVGIADMEEKIVYINPATRRMLGLGPDEEVIGKNLGTFFTSDSYRLIREEGVPHVLEYGTWDKELAFRHRDGSEIPVAINGMVIRDSKGLPRYLAAISRDTRPFKQAEEELLRTLAREKELGQLKSNFISIVSHEFRTPLGVILSATQILQRYRERLTAEARGQQLEKIARNTQQLTDLIEEVLVLGKVESGQMTCKPEPLELLHFCRTVLDEVVLATHRACPIRLDAGTSFGAARGDERLLRQILTNLLSNAVKYSSPGQAIDFVVEREHHDAIFVIRHRGIGIPAEDLPKLFHAFQRGRNVGQRPGSGLGLAIVRECVQLHGGQIQVQSKVGAGSAMTVRLPLFAKTRKPALARPL